MWLGAMGKWYEEAREKQEAQRREICLDRKVRDLQVNYSLIIFKINIYYTL